LAKLGKTFRCCQNKRSTISENGLLPCPNLVQHKGRYDAACSQKGTASSHKLHQRLLRTFPVFKELMNDKLTPILKWRRWALLFPTVKAAFGSTLFQPIDLDSWATSQPSDGALHAAKFLLALWNNQQVWDCGKFDVTDAMSIWDAEHRAAFVVWAEQPWWP
jgi:hypothetical protein